MKTEAQKRFKGSDNAEDLRQFYGTENYHKLAAIVYTDGVKYLCDSRKCYWLLTDIMLLALNVNGLKVQPFMTCELVRDGIGADLIFTDGNGNILFVHNIEMTDFADEGVCLYYIEGVLMLQIGRAHV